MGGGGKTYFIDKFVDDYLESYKTEKDEKKIKFLKITLFGLNNVSQIDEIIFQKLHPVLGHKYAKITGGMLKGALKIGLNFDTDGNGKPDSRLTIDPKDFSFFSDDKTSDKELIFIFDDLERTNIKLSVILGYINYLVEQSGFKVIILANEEKIKEEDKYKEVLQKNKALLKNIFKTADYNNLRHIRQTILDFEYFYNQLDVKFQKHDEIMKQLINEFFIFSIEIKSGDLNNKNFETFDYYLNMLSEKTEDEETPLEVVFTKHSLQNEYNILLNIEMWKEILLEGHIKKEAVKKILNSSQYFIDEQTESWSRLWYYRNLEDNEFKKYLNDVWDKFTKNEYKEQGKLLHVIALLLYFSKFNMIKQKQKEIITHAKKNIIECIKIEKWDAVKYNTYFDDAAYGLVFFDFESKNMKIILKYIKREVEKLFVVQIEEKAKVLLEDFENNNLVNLEKKLQHEFYEVPILSKIDIDGFVSMFQQLEHKNIYDIAQRIKKRYNTNNALEKILSEEKFWRSVNNKILNGIDVNNNPVKYNLLENLKSYIIKEILEKFKTEKNRLKILKEQDSQN